IRNYFDIPKYPKNLSWSLQFNTRSKQKRAVLQGAFIKEPASLILKQLKTILQKPAYNSRLQAVTINMLSLCASFINPTLFASSIINFLFSGTRAPGFP